MDAAKSIGPYRLEHLLGSGGMGEVYRAYDERLDRQVAIKRIRPDRKADTTTIQRFRREARAAAALAHPAIVQVFDILEADGNDWIVMEYVDGQSLAHLLRHGPLEVAVAIDIARQVAEGLAYAHEKGFIHRDLKTENVMISAIGKPKILDFGLAKRLRQDTASLTAVGSLLGTYRTMSPEQAMGLELDEKSDIFSFGILLYECLTAQQPFKADSAVSTLNLICNHQQESVEQLNPEVPPKLSLWIDRLLEKRPEDRPDAGQIVEALTSFSKSFDEVPKESAAIYAAETIEGGPLSPSTPGADSDSLMLTPKGWLLASLFLALAVWLLSQAPWLPSSESPTAESSLSKMGHEKEETAHQSYRRGMELLQRSDKEGHVDQALELFDALVDRKPDLASAHAGLARAWWRKYRRDRDERWLEPGLSAAQRAVALDQHLASAQVSLGLVTMELNQHDAAREAFETALRLDPSSMDLHRGLSQFYKKQGDLKAAETHLLRAIEIRPNDREPYDHLGTLYFDQSRLDEAKAAFERSIEVAPDNIFGYSNLAGVLFMQDQLDEAAALLQKALEIRPRADLYTNLGTMFFYKGLYEQAIEPFRKATELEEGAWDPLMWGNLGDAYRWAPGYDAETRHAYQRGIDLLRQMITKRPDDDPELRSRLALYLARRGDWQEAIKEASALEDREGLETATRFRLVLIYEQCGERQQALIALVAALEHGYPLAAVEREQELDRLRNDPGFAQILADRNRHR